MKISAKKITEICKNTQESLLYCVILGSERVYIDEMDIPGCEHAPCSIERGFNYLVHVVPSFLGKLLVCSSRSVSLISIPEGPVDSIEVTAYVRMWGALFAVPISSVNPCGFICPLQQYIEKPTLIFNVLFPDSLQRVSTLLYSCDAVGESVVSHVF